jgi:NAD(P)-dependent dehydrogenase (short-subunit alcohol dehydrogenase family)
VTTQTDAPDRAVLVTGASTGIGRSTALLLDGHGFTVFAGVRTEAAAATLAGDASEKLVPLILDVTKPDQIAAAAEKITASGLPLVGLVNNAGIAAAAPLEFIPIDDFRHQLEVNVVGQLAVTQAMLTQLRAAKGRIVNVTSIGGLVAGAMLGPYHASKFALEALTDTMRVELAPWGIHVSAVEPGQIATPIWKTSGVAADRMLAAAVDSSNGAVHELYADRIAGARRMAASGNSGLHPLEVAKVIERALTARRPRTRYPVGPDAKIGAAIIARLPDRLRDRLLDSRR